MSRSPSRFSGHLGLVQQQCGEQEPAGDTEPPPGAAPSAAQIRGSRDATPARRSHVSLSLVVGGDRRNASDGALARSLVAGEAWAVSETWHRFAPMVLTTAQRCLGSRSEAEDIAQEVFYRVFLKAKTLRDPDCLRSFIYSFAIRMLRTELRRRRLRSWLLLDPPEVPKEEGYETLDVESRDLLRRFYSLLDRLTPRDRLVFILRRMESMTVEETADQLHISASTVKRSMTHASNRLSRWIEADPELAGLLAGERWGR